MVTHHYLQINSTSQGSIFQKTKVVPSTTDYQGDLKRYLTFGCGNSSSTWKKKKKKKKKKIRRSRYDDPGTTIPVRRSRYDDPGCGTKEEDAAEEAGAWGEDSLRGVVPRERGVRGVGKDRGGRPSGPRGSVGCPCPRPPARGVTLPPARGGFLTPLAGGRGWGRPTDPRGPDGRPCRRRRTPGRNAPEDLSKPVAREKKKKKKKNPTPPPVILLRDPFPLGNPTPRSYLNPTDPPLPGNPLGKSYSAMPRPTPRAPLSPGFSPLGILTPRSFPTPRTPLSLGTTPLSESSPQAPASSAASSSFVPHPETNKENQELLAWFETGDRLASRSLFKPSI
ncbi:unnamed protein product [Bemisia tabaci]|uniref:Uncharacterized protein n=1 Tax=Bemisia tabaci TaxID=7038 RepID=A0A9P0ALQ7_BEMTA|nr:unnamed protein product [Bemisia tabaci]